MKSGLKPYNHCLFFSTFSDYSTDPVNFFNGTVNYDLPSAVDWRHKGAVTEVKNQRECNSCWAFTAVGALEAQQFLKNGTLWSLSPQNLIDCSTSFGNNGCAGGNAWRAFKYIQHNGGINTDKYYPYESKDGPCRYQAKYKGATASSFQKIPNGNELLLQEANAKVGPIAVEIDASRPTFRHYRSGIYYDSECSSHYVTHAVLVVGYGIDSLGQYYIVKNSWGSKWGDSGYIKMARNRNNNCGIATYAVYPTI